MIRYTRALARRAQVAGVLIATLTLVACGGGETPSPEPEGPPAAPTNVTTTGGPGYVIVAWEHDGARASGFEVTRERTAAPGALASHQTSRFTLDAEAREYVDTSVEPGATYAYAVAATGEDGASESATPPAGAGDVEIEPGIDLQVGTIDRRVGEGAGSAFIVYYVLPEEVRSDPALLFEVEIEGPAGWNDGQPYTFSHDGSSTSRAQGWAWAFSSGIDAVDGDYAATLTISGGAEPEVHTATASFDDADFLLGPPTDISVSDVSTTGLTATWTNPPGTQSGLVSLWRGEYGEALEQWTPTYDTTHAFDGFDLEDGVHMVEVVAFSFDFHGYPVKEEPMGASVDVRLVVVGEELSPLCEDAGQVVAIPDGALQQAVRNELGRASGELTCSDLALLEGLDARESGVAELEGLQYANRLTYLQLNGNEVSDLTPILGLHQLTGLGLDGNPVPDHGVLAGFTDLWYLSVGEAGVTDLSFVEGMTGLTRLYAWNDQIEDLGPVAALSNLEVLHVQGGEQGYDDLAPLAGLTQLVDLSVGGPPLVDDAVWPALENLTNLRALELWDAAVTDTTALSGLTSLEHLDLSGSDIESLAFVGDLPELTSLWVGHTQVSDPSPLAGATSLVDLDLRELGIDDLAFLGGLEELSFVDLRYNHVTSLAPLVANPGIGSGDEVWASHNLLDLDDPQVQADVDALVGRGVELDVDPQSLDE